MTTDYPSKLSVTVVPLNGLSYQVIEFHGDLDKAGLDMVKDQLQATSDTMKALYLVFDFQDLNFINSESIGFLMTLHSHLVKLKKGLAVVNAKAHVKDVLEVIGIMNVLPYADSVEAFAKTLVQ